MKQPWSFYCFIRATQNLKSLAMKFRASLIIFLLSTTHSIGQSNHLSYEIVNKEELSKLFTNETRSNLNIKYPIYRAYKYYDKSGKYYLLLTESRDSVTSEKDTLNKNIKALNIKMDGAAFSKKWEINDFINSGTGETTIWFWTKYIALKDYDNDSLMDPIIVYGTTGLNGYDDGRIKFIIYYKGKKVTIRHQNGVLDFERHTQIDKTFYSLPKELQAHVRSQMKTMIANEQAIFPAGWEKAMINKQTYISEIK